MNQLIDMASASGLLSEDQIDRLRASFAQNEVHCTRLINAAIKHSIQEGIEAEGRRFDQMEYPYSAEAQDKLVERLLFSTLGIVATKKSSQRTIWRIGRPLQFESLSGDIKATLRLSPQDVAATEAAWLPWNDLLDLLEAFSALARRL